MSEPNEESTGYLVIVRATVTKHVWVEGCTREEAIKDPFKYATDEMEVDQSDWEVLRVEEDKDE